MTLTAAFRFLKKYFLVSAWLLSLLLLTNFSSQPPPAWDAETPVFEVLQYLGETPPGHYLENITPEMIKRGEDIIRKGRTIGSDGALSGYVSKYYDCTSCHNITIEDPDLRASDPEARLTYVQEKNIPFLQGTTFYGAVNKESWYNDDYVKKYGEMVYEANKDIKAAIQLCATECAQGRRVTDWEIEAMLAYLWSLGYQLGDLDMSAADYQTLNAQAADPSNHEELREWVKSFYLLKSPATFVEVPEDKQAGYPLEGNAERGKAIYNTSCQFCHRPYGVSNFWLDDSELTFRKLRKNMAKANHFSIYEMIRHGTYAVPGHKPYMPLYPKERMSDQQVEDLRAYIENNAM